MQKNNKNNTCKVCKQHIDKSDATNNWMTIIVSGYNKVDWEKEESNQYIKGERFTLCSNCAFEIKVNVSRMMSEKEVSQ